MQLTKLITPLVFKQKRCWLSTAKNTFYTFNTANCNYSTTTHIRLLATNPSNQPGKCIASDLSDLLFLSDQEVYSLLDSGAGLSLDDIKLLKDANFKASSLGTIAFAIQKDKDALSIALQSFPTIPLEILNNIINWIGGSILCEKEIELKNETEESWLAKTLESLKFISEDDMMGAVEKIYDSCFSQTCSKPTELPTLSNLLEIECPLIPEMPIKATWNKSQTRFTRNNLPISFTGKYDFKKYQLPYIPSFQTFSELDETVEYTEKGSFILISPSGSGKTGLMVRSLSKWPGIYITGTSSNSGGSGITTDLSVECLVQNLKGYDHIRAFATVRQQCILILIAKLLHISQLVKLAEKDQQVLEPFEGNLFSYLTFNQGNGNTRSERIIFEKLLESQYEWCQIDHLRRLLVNLLYKVQTKLQTTFVNKNVQFGKLIVCVDEAHILEEHSPKRFISVNGEEKGLLSILANEITLLKGNIKASFYAGTSFSVDISGVIQSTLKKTESKPTIIFMTKLIKLDKKQFFDYVDKHVDLDEHTISQIEKHVDSFPIRIRQAAFFLEFYINERMNNIPTYSLAFSKAKIEGIDYMRTKIESFIKHYKMKNLKRTFLNYVIHFNFPGLFGRSFSETDKEIAHILLSSGMANPSDSSMTTFEANDALSNEVADMFLSKLLGGNSVRDMNLMELASHILKNTNYNKDIETAIAIGLLDLSQGNKLVSDIFPTISVAKGAIFKCNKILNGPGYIDYCKSLGVNVPQEITGEQLFITETISFTLWSSIHSF